jgi:acyl carrier protein
MSVVTEAPDATDGGAPGPEATPVESIVRSVVAAVARREVGDRPLDATWRELAIDSLDLLQVILDSERAFGVDIPDEAVLGFATAGDLVAYLERALHPR